MHFNPRPREEGDSTASALWTLSVYFNPRPREEGDYVAAGSRLSYFHFNPRPREEGDVSDVSQTVIELTISIHALVKRATWRARTSHPVRGYFNPRPREEGDFLLL